MVEIKKILFPCDFREDFSKIIPYVRSVSQKYNGKISLIHVVQDIHRWGTGYLPHRSMDDLQKEALEEAEKAMDKVCEQHFADYSDLQRKVVSGDPADEILKTIETDGIDMIIMGTHGRKSLEHVIWGSVAENVVKRSPVPVLTVNPSELK